MSPGSPWGRISGALHEAELRWQLLARGEEHFARRDASMNALMAGMIPVMVILMSRDMSAMEPSSVRFLGTMSLAFVVGTPKNTASPSNPSGLASPEL